MKKFLQKFGRLLLILGVVLAIGIYFLLRYFAIDKQPFPEPPDDTVYYAADGEVTPYETLDQNLNWEEQQYLWFLSQGSEIIPYSWFTHLEQKDTTSLFRSVKNMSKFKQYTTLKLKLVSSKQKKDKKNYLLSEVW